MKNNFSIRAVLNFSSVSVLILFLGCAAPNINKNISTFTSTDTGKYNNTTGRVDIYFEGVAVDKEFKQIGFVESIGKENASNEEILTWLKYEAYLKGADAVMNVKKHFKRRGSAHDEKYSASVFSGVAIKYLDSSGNNTKPDPKFIQFVQKQQEKMERGPERKYFWSMAFLATIGLFLILIYR